MRGFAIVADKGVVFDADCGKAVFGVGAAVGAGGVASEAGQVFDGCFGAGWHGQVVSTCCIVLIGAVVCCMSTGAREGWFSWSFVATLLRTFGHSSLVTQRIERQTKRSG
eukprot:scaffold6178_cov148-Skeletonema_marinoi.AAC.3